MIAKFWTCENTEVRVLVSAFQCVVIENYTHRGTFGEEEGKGRGEKVNKWG